MSAAVVPTAIRGGVVSVHVARPSVHTIAQVTATPHGTDSVSVDKVGITEAKASGTAYHKPAQERPAPRE